MFNWNVNSELTSSVSSRRSRSNAGQCALSFCDVSLGFSDAFHLDTSADGSSVCLQSPSVLILSGFHVPVPSLPFKNAQSRATHCCCCCVLFYFLLHIKVGMSDPLWKDLHLLCKLFGSGPQAELGNGKVLTDGLTHCCHWSFGDLLINNAEWKRLLFIIFL